MRRPGYIKRQSQAELVEKYRMLGESEAFLDTMEQVSRAAKVNRPVLIIGERGTGKELVAARLHYLSPRWQQPKISINCASFSPDLLESEVFGHEQGAFTGASRQKPGRFELAHEGTLFLDELAQSPMALQEKILRVLEYGEFERVGGIESVNVDVRVMAATNQDLPALCDEGRFRHDLLDRLSFEVITIPALRQRKEDIPLLASVFAVRMARELELDRTPSIHESAMEAMLDYSWPGNIRELKNVVERAVYRNHEVIEDIDFDPFDSPYRPDFRIGVFREKPAAQTLPAKPSDSEPVPEVEEKQDWEEGLQLPEAIEVLEKRMIGKALEENQFNQKKAAEQLGVSYYQFRRTMKRLDLP